MARELARRGYPALRFDFAGIGDSPAPAEALPFPQSATRDTIQAMNLLERSLGVRRFILLGLCSGAEIALRTAVVDPRVRAAMLINGMFGIEQVRSRGHAGGVEASSRTQMRYYKKKLRNWRSVARLFTLKSNYRKIVNTLWQSFRRTKTPADRADPASNIPIAGLGPILERLSQGVALCVVCAEGSSAYDILQATVGPYLERLCREHAGLRVEMLRDIDHVFTPLWTQDLLGDLVLEWLESVPLRQAIGRA
jgi:pimeloyl-ACP methyl ester carboxylesterase